MENVSETEMKSRKMFVGIRMRIFDYLYGILLGELDLKHTGNFCRALQSLSLLAVDEQNVA